MPLIFAGPDTLKCITREYRAIDEWGNVSDSICKVVIYVTAIDDLIWPKMPNYSARMIMPRFHQDLMQDIHHHWISERKKGLVYHLYIHGCLLQKNASYWIGRSADGLRDSVSLATMPVPVGSPASAQVCLTAPENITLTFRYGSTNLPTSD
ncbi:MAG: hypothetical protein IPJ13_19765 [Saprospiraceae bacterium]|nr:hypothetical protein [Saprospiraceae bacterium]